jgi:hypothetical protein
MILDGLRDAGYGAPIATDPAGDLASPGPGGWSGTAWSDLTALYCQNDDANLYVYVDLPHYSQSTSSGQIGLLIENGAAGGGAGDPWGNAITFAHANKPDYVIRGNIPGIGGNPPDDNNGWTELRVWSGSAWSAGGANWGGIGGGGQVGGKIAYADSQGVEFKIPLADIGNPALGTTLNLQFFTTQSGNTKGAYDTVPSDDQSTGWDDPTTLVNYAACALTAAGPTATPTATATAGPSPTPTATPTATAAPPSGCAGAVAGDGVVVTGALYHDNTDPAYKTPTGAILPTETAVLRLRTCQDDVQQVQALVWRTGDPLAAPSFTYAAAVAAGDGTHDIWEVTVPGDTVNLWYQFRITDGATVGQFQPISGNNGPGRWYTGALQNPSWSLPVIQPTPTPPPDFAVPGWIHDAVIYQIFPDRFRNGDASNDPVDGTAVYEPGGCAGYPANCSGTYPDAVTSGDLGQWVCEHRHNPIAGMVQFRQATVGEPVTDWQNIGGAPSNHIAFGRGSRGFVAINRTDSAATTTYQTGMAAGVYCDVTQGQLIDNGAACSGRSITVNESGQIVA